jgi:PhnB protein
MSQSVTPYLTVKGAAEAIAFYQKAFGATENMRMPAQDGQRLLHADLSLNGGQVFLSDEFSDQGGPAAPQADRPSPMAVSLAFDKPAQVDATFAQAVSAGARSLMEPADQFWGARFAMITDPFGYRWMLNAPLSQTAG